MPAITGVGNNPFIGDTDATPLPEFFFDGLGGTNTLVFNINGTEHAAAVCHRQWHRPGGTSKGKCRSTNASAGLNAYFRNVNEINRTGIGATPGGADHLRR